MTTTWQRYLLVGVVASVGLVFLPLGLGRDAVYCLVGASGVVAIVVGVCRNRPSSQRAWWLMVAGNAAWVLGDAMYSWYQDIALVAPFPSPADAAYLVAYPLLAAGLWVLVRSRVDENGVTAFLDSAILTVGLGLLSWVFLIEPTWAGGATFLERVVGVAYPIGDVLLFAMLMRLVTAGGGWNAASRLLAGSFAILLAVDSLFQASTWVPAIEARLSILDPGWLIAYVLWGAAALHPSMRTLSSPAPTRHQPSRVGRLVALAAAATIGPAILVGELVAGVPLHAWSVVAASTVLIALILARMIRMVRQLEQQAARLIELADTDYVTGLANRRRFVLWLGELLNDSPGPAGMLMVINLERFTEITDTLGDRTGEDILRAVGARIRGLVNSGAVVARTGDHAFGILDPATTTGEGADSAALRIRCALEQPLDLHELNVSLEVSIGALLLPNDAAEPTQALQRADLALSAAQSRPDRAARYGAEMETGSALALLLIGELPDALLNGDIVLHYQPQVDLRTGLVFGVEALARWQHPGHGLLGPDSFIPAAEQNGLIGPLTQYVLDRALAQNARWAREGVDLTVAVNLSVRNLLDSNLVDDVRSALERHGVAATSLELEITESSAMVDPRRSMEVLGALASIGVTLSVDDYGTGHSSLAYLQRLPVRRLKIDRSFVGEMVRDDASAAIVRSTIELARNLHLDVVAEGVEDDATLLTLRDMGCPAAQGFGLGRPVVPPLVVELIRQIESRIPGVLGRERATPGLHH